MEPLNEEMLMKVIEGIMQRETFSELEDADPMIAMAIIDIIEDSIRMYHRLTVDDYFKNITEESLTKL
jgi:hypothetical protein|tara:strand:+ start:79 stop:282 length:204 start_codon:yes stop_codon:yes gene_type:complete